MDPRQDECDVFAERTERDIKALRKTSKCSGFHVPKEIPLIAREIVSAFGLRAA